MGEYKTYKAEVEKVKKYRGINNNDIARLTGYSKSAIDKFMADNILGRDSEKVAIAISNALGVPLEGVYVDECKDDNNSS